MSSRAATENGYIVAGGQRCRTERIIRQRPSAPPNDAKSQSGVSGCEDDRTGVGALRLCDAGLHPSADKDEKTAGHEIREHWCAAGDGQLGR